VTTILAIPGSLRSASWNRQLLRAAREHAPDGMDIRLYDDLASIPPFNEDLETDGGPQSVRALHRDVAGADGLLISTPEYNWSIPGVLKNAIDWLSRDEVLAGKPVAIMGVTAGRWGTRLAQAALRQVLTATESLVLPTPALFIHDAPRAFDAEGRLSDAATAKQLEHLLHAFARWIGRV